MYNDCLASVTKPPTYADGVLWKKLSAQPELIAFMRMAVYMLLIMQRIDKARSSPSWRMKFNTIQHLYRCQTTAWASINWSSLCWFFYAWHRDVLCESGRLSPHLCLWFLLHVNDQEKQYTWGSTKVINKYSFFDLQAEWAHIYFHFGERWSSNTMHWVSK